MKIVATAGTAIIGSIFMLGLTTAGDAAEVRVASALAMSVALKAVSSEFEKSTGHKLILSFGTAGQVKSRVEAGDALDVAITTAPAIDDLIKLGKLTPGSRVDVANVGIGVAVRSGAPKPDISSVDSFKRALLAAKSISRGDPAAGGAAGVHVARVLAQLGIASEVEAKSKLTTGPAISELTAKGETEIAITQISEIVPVSGVDLVGPLPKEIQNLTLFSAGVVANTKAQEAAKAFITFLTGPAAAPAIKKTGMEPG